MMKKIVILLCLSLSLFGCESFLNINPESEVVNDDMFNTAEGVEDALYGVYMSMIAPNMYGGNMSVLIPEILGQNFTTTDANLMYLSRLDFERSYTRTTIEGMWKTSYLVISYLNNIIGNLNEKSEKDFHYYNLYRGEALGLRAAIHFDILRLYAVNFQSTDENAKAKAIPYVTQYSFQVTPYFSVEEVYDKIIADLKEAETCLKADESLMPTVRLGSEKGFTGARELHFNYYAAQAMLARVYWMKGDLKNAKLYADQVIRSGKFTFADKKILNSYLKRKVSLTETIWGLYTTNLNSFLYSKQVSSNILTLPSGWKELYEKTQGPEPGKDYRLTDWFSTIEYKGDQKDVCVKIMDETSDTAKYNGGGYFGVNMVRIPEMYFIMSEALLDEGNTREAGVYLDSVVSARGMIKFADRDFSKDITLDDIMRERQKELYGEGQWWFCLKRLYRDIYVYNLNTTYPGSDKIYTLPIPTNEDDYREDE